MIAVEDIELLCAYLLCTYCLRLLYIVLLDRCYIPLAYALSRCRFSTFAVFEVDSRVVAVSILIATTLLADIEPKILYNVVDILKEVIKRGPSLRF